MLLEHDGNLAQAVTLVAQAFGLFESLGSPNRKIAASSLARLRDAMGAEAFEAALSQAATEPAVSRSAVSDQGGSQEPITRQDLLQLVSNNTVAVLTGAPEHRDQWQETVKELRGQVTDVGDQALGALLDVISKLLAGTPAGELTDQVPAEMQPVWRAIMDGVEGSQDRGGVR